MKSDEDDQSEKKSAMSEKLVEALTGHYQPAPSFADSDDTKSTQELIAEMSDMEEIHPYEVNRLMEEHGFKINYNGTNYVWLLKVKN